MKKKILALVTGGTFDKEYNLITGELYFQDTHLPEILQRGRCNLDVNIKTLMMIDSLQMTEEDRKIIVEHCQSSTENHILITHGTDTMCETASVIAQANGLQDKTIVLVGAMIPYYFGMSSDGFFNLGSALAFVQSIEPGVYISMHGDIFHWNNVIKNRSNGYFERINAEKP
jgi:L-asparaginase